MKKSFKFLSKIFLIIIAAMLVISTCSYANSFPWETARASAEAASGVDSLDKSAINITGSILSVVKYVATGIALIMIVVIAAKYMIAAPGDRADIKKHAIAYVTGALILFGSAALVDIMQDFASNNVKAS